MADTETEFVRDYLEDVARVAKRLDVVAIERVAAVIQGVRTQCGRLFCIGCGGGASIASHAANDFRKLCGIQAYAGADNIAGLTADANDQGWEHTYDQWLYDCRLTTKDCVMVFSVGGGDEAQNVSANIVLALEYAKSVKAIIVGIVGRDGGATARSAHACVIVPTVAAERQTAYTESFQSVLLHLLVSHPRLKVAPTKWESLT